MINKTIARLAIEVLKEANKPLTELEMCDLSPELKSRRNCQFELCRARGYNYPMGGTRLSYVLFQLKSKYVVIIIKDPRDMRRNIYYLNPYFARNLGDLLK